jgi:hypothetical protein
MSMNTHKIYLSVFAATCLLAAIVVGVWRERVRDQARRDAVIESQKSDISDIERRLASVREQTQNQIAELERRRKEVLVSPQRAPEVIRELVPMRTPIQSPALTTDSLPQPAPDAPSVSLNKQQQVDLAQYALACKQCSVERDQFEQQVRDEQEIVARQKIEIEAATKAAKGGSLWQRTKRVLKWGVIFGGAGYMLGRAQR